MMEAENFTIFIKNSIRFPLFNFEKGNLLPNLTARDMKTCRFHPDKDPFCPILRVGDVVKFAGQDFAKLARTGGVLGIKIGWVCDLDKAWDQCIPKYSFTRLDSVSEKSSVSPGYNFRFAKYYKMENGSEYRTLLKAFGIRFDVLVYGNAGKFNIIPTIISSVAAFTSVGVGTVLCDIILLNFLKGADQYKAKKFEEVNETTLKIAALTNPVYPSDQTTAEKQSTDSGAFSIGH
ncbi:P2X purinoceptor 3 isoform X4 [Homo sapiens]|uniref:P2X purinoceptor 3 isoform X4 n=2 Tax=Catarrhini TaxID=9526 RepID=UPI0005D0331E|nr:P2X purinoceptor 3 isoform X4 [Homo sapiens]|eukprot:XP_011543375.1 P2X purinoceptor 3 isoform X4 [Homo sapiens]